jgi:Domain of unknown function (DUF1772)
MTAYLLGAGRAWLLSSVLIASVVPYTLLVVEPVNEQIKLLDSSAERTVTLLTRWGAFIGSSRSPVERPF